LSESRLSHPVVVGIIVWFDLFFAVVLLIDINYSVCGRENAVFTGVFFAIFVGAIPALIVAIFTGVSAKGKPAFRSPHLWLIVTALIIAAFGTAYVIEPDYKSVHPLEPQKCQFF
jgi:hypothetical protein